MNEQADKFARAAHRELWAGRLKTKPPRTHLEMMQFGVDQGWWEEYDDKGPIKVHMASIEAWRGSYRSQLLADLGLFDSVGDARRAGWTQKIQGPETFSLFKGRVKVVIE